MDMKLVVLCVLIWYSYNKSALAWTSYEPLRTDVVCAFKGGLNLDCSSDKVIVVHSADYGFSPGNKCNVRDEKYRQGCSNDVMAIFDKVCTGMTTCEYPGGVDNQIPTARLTKSNTNCKELNNIYLTVQYHCEINALKNGCTVQHIPKGIISSRTTSCLNQAIIIFAPGKQRIVLYHLSIAPVSSTEYFTIKEGTDIIQVAGSETRKREVYRSKGNQLELVLGPSSFVIQYEFNNACDIYEPADDTHVVVSYNASKTMVVCTNNRQVQWTLTCEAGQWTGTKSECDAKNDKLIFGSAALIGIAVASAVVILILSSAVMVLCCQRKRKAQRIASSPGVSHVAQQQNTDADTLLGAQYQALVHGNPQEQQETREPQALYYSRVVSVNYDEIEEVSIETLRVQESANTTVDEQYITTTEAY